MPRPSQFLDFITRTMSGNLVRISKLKSDLIYKFSILDTYHQDTLYLREEGCEDLWLFVDVKTGPRTKNVWETLIYKCRSITGWGDSFLLKKRTDIALGKVDRTFASSTHKART
jgi:hypothetical protein